MQQRCPKDGEQQPRPMPTCGFTFAQLAPVLDGAMISFSFGRMKLVIQRVARASVMVNGTEADIGPGLLGDSGTPS